MRTDASRLQDKASKYAGPIDVVKQVVKNDGLLGASSISDTLLGSADRRFVLRSVRGHGGHHVEVSTIICTFPRMKSY